MSFNFFFNAKTPASSTAPLFDFNFSETKSILSQKGDNLITFARSTAGTYIDASGLVATAGANVPRFDHNPSTLESVGLLIEEERTNTCHWSKIMDYWSKGAVTVVEDATTAPDGTSTADKLVEAVTATQVVGIGSGSAVGNSHKAFSIWLKADGRSKVRLAGDDITNYGASFDLTDGSVLQQGANVISAHAEEYPDGWWRCCIVYNWDQGYTGFNWVIILNPADGSYSSYTGDGASGIYAWGGQCEAGKFCTSFIPTAADDVTRTADSAAITGSNFSQVTGADTKAVRVNFDSDNIETRGLVSLNDGTDANSVEFFTSGTDPKMVITSASVEQCSLTGDAVVSKNKLAGAFVTDDFALVSNGGNVVTAASGGVPVVDRMNIGSDVAGNIVNGHIGRVTAWGKRLPDAQLKKITL